MVDTLEGQWQTLALGSSPQLAAPNDYSVVISNDNAEDREAPVEGISFSPKKNKANKMRIDVPPADFLEDLTYLGGLATVYLGSSILFEGDIQEITHTQEEDRTYSLNIHSPGFRLKDESVNRSVSDETAYDVIVDIVDKFNDWDSEFENYTDDDNTDQTIEGGDIKVQQDLSRKSLADGATTTFSDVGSDSKDVDTIYSKLDMPSGTEVQVDLTAGGNSVSKTHSGATEGFRGDWFRFDPPVGQVAQGSYDLTYTMDSGTVLRDWISLTSQDIRRDLEPVVSGEGKSGEVVQSGSGVDIDTVFSPDANEPYIVENGKLKAVQVNYVSEDVKYNGGVYYQRDELSGGEAYGIADQTDSQKFEFTLDYNMEAEIRYRANAEDGTHPRFTISVDGNTIETALEDALTGGIEWRRAHAGDLEAGTHEVTFQGESGAGDFVIDVVTITDERFATDLNFDNTVHENSGYLDGPELYPPTEYAYVKSDEYTSQDNVVASEIKVSSSVASGTRLQTTFDGGVTWVPSDGTENDTNNVRAETAQVTSTVKGRWAATALKMDSTDKRDDTPRLGYSGNSIDLWQMKIDTGTIDIINSSDIRDNRLAAISSICEERDPTLRWEGNEAIIFQTGQKTVNPDLRSAEIRETNSVEGAYTSVEVIGESGVTSGRVEKDTPSPVTRHKVLEDPSITNQKDANRRADSFLAKNGDIRYRAKIEAPPTLAPIGYLLSGSNFSHGRDLQIETVRYSNDRATIECGRPRSLSQQLQSITSKQKKTNKELTE